MNVPPGADTDPRAPWNHDMPELRIEDVTFHPDRLEIEVSGETKNLYFDTIEGYDELHPEWEVKSIWFNKVWQEIILYCMDENYIGFKITIDWKRIDKLFN